MIAETAYLFRHALLREATYQLQMPGDRSQLHAIAFEVIEALFGGRAPEPPAMDAPASARMRAHATDVVAEELADHAARAPSGETRALAARYRRRAAVSADWSST